MALSVEVRFWPKVDRRGPDVCWPWLRCTQAGGYGWFGLRAGELERGKAGPVAAHRVAFRLVHGHWPVPHGLHGCDNPLCCNAENPDHVHEGTQLQNMAERIMRGRPGAPGASRGSMHPEAKLSGAEAAEVRALKDAGLLNRARVVELARELGVSIETIYRVARRATYREG